MRDTIVHALRQIEQKEQVKIVYACESGSRAWGFPSADSDYDVRFIYAHPTNWYLSVQDRPDVIERPINDGLDLVGWDLRKALRLLRKSNPPLLEWLESPMIYLEETGIPGRLRDSAATVFASRTCLHHYLSMARGNFREYLQGDMVKVKKYFYVLRPVLACLWLERRQGMPPMEFGVLVQELLPPGDLRSAINRLLARKKSGEELALEPRIEPINAFLAEEIARLEGTAASGGPMEPPDCEVLDEVFRAALRELWKDKGGY